MPGYSYKKLIVKVNPDEDIHTGASLCNDCGKIMPVCWDVVCKKCRKTFCYLHTGIKGDYWYCFGCISNKKIENILFRKFLSTWEPIWKIKYRNYN